MRKPYNWKDGPDVIQEHSIAKHNILRSYLTAYFKTLACSPRQDHLRITLVDGFAGGGLYTHHQTKDIIKGSPFICLDAVKEAEYHLNIDKKKPFKIEANYFFVEKDKYAQQHLEQALKKNGYSNQLGNEIILRHCKFDETATDIIDFIKKKSPRNGRSIFILDQYGYKEVPTSLISKIFQKLPSAEVILTFGIDSFLNYASDSTLSAKLLNDVGIPDILEGRSFEQIKTSERDWRLFIQSALYRELVSKCGAKHFTPFFIRNRKGHGDYWLIHLSQHHRARDVMTQVHWQNHNNFIHYGGAGINMFNILGYDPKYTEMFSNTNQNKLGFEFDEDAKALSVETLMEQIPKVVYAHDTGVSFGELFATTCNHSPASAMIYRQAIENLVKHKEVEVISTDGTYKGTAQQIKDSDQIMPPSQRTLF